MLWFIYLGQEPLTLDAPRSRVILHVAGDAHDTQDLLDQLSRMGYRLTTRLTLGPVVLARRCRRHIYTTSYSLRSGSYCPLLAFA